MYGLSVTEQGSMTATFNSSPELGSKSEGTVTLVFDSDNKLKYAHVYIWKGPVSEDVIALASQLAGYKVKISNIWGGNGHEDYEFEKDE